jgi:outer membrane protein assembly factor BamB
MIQDSKRPSVTAAAVLALLGTVSLPGAPGPARGAAGARGAAVGGDRQDERGRAGDWPCWRGPHFDGISRETGLLKGWPEGGPRVLWTAELSGGFSAVAVAGGRLYTHTARGKKEEIVLCLDAATGKELWRHRYPCDYDRLVMLRENYDSGPRATPAVDGAFVYTIGTSGTVLCLEARTGQQVWQRDLLEMAGRKCPPQGYCGSPLVVGAHVYVHPGGSRGNSIAALNKKDGRTVWQALDDEPSYASPIPITVDGSPQIVYFTGQAVVGVDPKDGRLLWRHPWQTEPPIHGATPIDAGGQVFISSNYGTGAALLRLRKEGGPQLVWQARSMQNQYATSVLYRGALYGFSGFRLCCVDGASGELRWSKSGIGKGSLLIADGHLIVLSERGDLILAEATPTAYVEKARCKPFRKGPCCSVPVLAGGRLYLRNEKLLLALDLGGRRP